MKFVIDCFPLPKVIDVHIRLYPKKSFTITQLAYKPTFAFFGTYSNRGIRCFDCC